VVLLVALDLWSRGCKNNKGVNKKRDKIIANAILSFKNDFRVVYLQNK
jgi:hypothetical protein